MLTMNGRGKGMELFQLAAVTRADDCSMNPGRYPAIALKSR